MHPKKGIHTDSSPPRQTCAVHLLRADGGIYSEFACRAGDTPAKGAPPLTMIFTLPPSRSFTLLKTILSNKGVACMPKVYVSKHL